MKAYLMILLVWISYGLIHSLLASPAVKKYFSHHHPFFYKWYRLLYNLLALALLIAAILFTRAQPTGVLYHPSGLSLAAGLLLALPGLALMLNSISRYFFNLSGLRSLIEQQEQPFLLIGGAHRYVRHPLYLGTFLFIWGLALIWPLGSFFITDFAITAYTVAAIPLEESKLISQFGEQYLSYRKKVPMLIPWKGRAWD